MHVLCESREINIKMSNKKQQQITIHLLLKQTKFSNISIEDICMNSNVRLLVEEKKKNIIKTLRLVACNATGHSNVKFRIDKMEKRNQRTHTNTCMWNGEFK